MKLDMQIDGRPPQGSYKQYICSDWSSIAITTKLGINQIEVATTTMERLDCICARHTTISLITVVRKKYHLCPSYHSAGGFVHLICSLIPRLSGFILTHSMHTASGARKCKSHCSTTHTQYQGLSMRKVGPVSLLRIYSHRVYSCKTHFYLRVSLEVAVTTTKPARSQTEVAATITKPITQPDWRQWSQMWPTSHHRRHWAL